MSGLSKLTSTLAEKLGMSDQNGQELIQTLKATAFRGDVSDAQMTALMVVANQYGLNPWTKEIYAFPDKHNGIVPVVGVDGWSRIINQHSQFNGMEFRASDNMETMEGAKPAPEWMECVIYRKDREHPIVIREYLDEVYRAPFKPGMSGPWQTHTKRFFRHKTMIQCARLAFGYVGIYDQDEAERVVDMGAAQRAEPKAAEPAREEKPGISNDDLESQVIPRMEKALAGNRQSLEDLLSWARGKYSLTSEQVQRIQSLAVIEAEGESA